MADLEAMGLLYAPHTSAGRVPTEKGLRLFVDGLLEIGQLAPDERAQIEARIHGTGRGIEDVLTQATTMLSGLSRCAGLVVAAKQDTVLKHVEFVAVAPGKALVVIVGEDGQVENRLIDTPLGLPVSALSEASNYLSARLRGRTLEDARAEITVELDTERAELDVLTAKIVAEGLATLASSDSPDEKVLIVRGTSHLLDSVEAQIDLERVRTLFDDIERKADLIRLMELAKQGDGVRIFIGSENRLFSLSRLFDRGRALCECAGQGRGRDRGSWPDTIELWKDHSDGRSHRKGDRPSSGLSESDMSDDGQQETELQAEAMELDNLRAEAADLRDRLLRALAETENTRRRAEREKQDASQYAVTKFARDMLQIADNFARALAAAPGCAARFRRPQIKAVLEGVEATERQLLQTLERPRRCHHRHNRRQVRSQSAPGHCGSAGRRQACRQHRRCRAVGL
ncbi:MAG: nucleotide exchange factor GrpE [Rhizomicrobium sp.]